MILSNKPKVNVNCVAIALCSVCLLLEAACGTPTPAQPTAPATSASNPAAATAPSTAAPTLAVPAASPQVASSPVSLPPSTPGAVAVPPLNPPVKVRAGTLSLAAEAPLFVALDRGYFRDEGLDVEFIPFTTASDQIAPIASGQLDVGSGSPDSTQFNAVARGIDIKLVEATVVGVPDSNSSALMVRQDLIDSGRYKSPADFKGMTISSPNLTGSGRLYIQRILAQNGLTETDVNVVPLSFPDAATALSNKAVDAAWLSEPFITTVKQRGIASIGVSAGDAVPTGAATLIMFMSPSFVSQQPEAAGRFVVAWLRGTRDSWRALETTTQNPEEVIASINAHTALKDPGLVKAIVANKGLVGFQPNGGIDVSQLNIFQDFYVSVGSETQVVDLSRAVDNSYNDYALQRLGRVSP